MNAGLWVDYLQWPEQLILSDYGLREHVQAYFYTTLTTTNTFVRVQPFHHFEMFQSDDF